MKNQRRQVGARFVARARGAFGFARSTTARNSASLGCPARRGPNVAQDGPVVTENADAERAKTVVQIAGVPDTLRWGAALPGPQTADTAAAG
jgi:hypothetical protein